MQNEIRKQTGLIVRRNGEYMVGRILGSRELRWSVSPYDAWWTRDRDKAEYWARKTGGIVMMFNKATGEKAVL